MTVASKDMNNINPLDFIPPYRTKTVEPIIISSLEQRKKWIQDAKYNLFNLKSEQIIIDLITDSGTSAMSAQQTSLLITGDEAYAGASSFYRFKSTVEDLTGFKYIFPTHQGRAAERLLFSVLGGPGKIIPNNTHFDTTRANIEFTGATALDLPKVSNDNYFAGDIDLKNLDLLLEKNNGKIPLVMITITNDTGGGKPVSLENIQQVRKICDKYHKPLFIDGCRFAENAFFIKRMEKAYSKHSIKSIVQKVFSLADGMTMSAKKDGLAHIGGWIAFNNQELLDDIESLLILTEGFRTYGGLAGRDLDVIAKGLQEVIQEEYLESRINSTAILGEMLEKIGIPTIKPYGGHAIFIDAKKFLPEIKPLEYPAQALGIELYIQGGIRAGEIGSLMFGKKPNTDREVAAKEELLRLALPRRMYHKSHFNYIAEVFGYIFKNKNNIKGLKIIKEPKYLRHFSAELKPIDRFS